MVACLAFVASCGAPATAPQAAPAAPIVISEAWAAPTPAGISVGSAYAIITNTQDVADTLVSVETARAERTEVHEMAMEGAVMRMRRVETLSIPAGGGVTLAPGGLHLMLYDLPTPLIAGETIVVRFRFAEAGMIEAELPVEARPRARAAH